jgi:hypothetical protein
MGTGKNNCNREMNATRKRGEHRLYRVKTIAKTMLKEYMHDKVAF